MRELTFSPERALESLLYLAAKLNDATVHEVLKLRYFADKLHLQKYGSTASGDDYVAMQFGPVASHTYDMLKAARGERTRWIHPRLVDTVSGQLSVRGKYVVPQRQANLECLSPADVECLDEALAMYGNMPFDQRTDLSHDAAWQRAWDATADGSLRGGEMSIVDIVSTLENADEVLEFLNDK
ncbi:SocA family protein [Burkholderia seminalis]|uniref:Panacea domain-containing protein n=1 Tax=Burkholderia seminalis TaxID=488731 RepID=UPI001CF26432|nr:Panacea domain-containing protein [Burkholderia seminalis]MCA7955353.1 SocA family protein [Burkholderia seminalis]